VEAAIAKGLFRTASVGGPASPDSKRHAPLPDYQAALEARHGQDAAHQILLATTPRPAVS